MLTGTKGFETGSPNLRQRGLAPLHTPGDSMCHSREGGNPEKDKVPILFERERGIVMVEYPQAPGRDLLLYPPPPV